MAKETRSGDGPISHQIKVPDSFPSAEAIQNWLNRAFAYISVDKSYFQNLSAIKEYYAKNEPYIMDHHSSGSKYIYRAYPCDWMKIFSPIEFAAWCSIRSKGGLPLYPQYPAGKYFLDFGNPYWKIGVELDGKNFHDTEKDRIRDAELQKSGWRIFRISGREMNNNNYDDVFDAFSSEYEDDIETSLKAHENWLIHTGDGVLESIRVVFFGASICAPEEYISYIRGYCYESLNAHNLLNYNL